ncbi:hypothetical protein V2J09_001456 [Rumex salicifolius]
MPVGLQVLDFDLTLTYLFIEIWSMHISGLIASTLGFLRCKKSFTGVFLSLEISSLCPLLTAPSAPVFVNDHYRRPNFSAEQIVKSCCKIPSWLLEAWISFGRWQFESLLEVITSELEINPANHIPLVYFVLLFWSDWLGMYNIIKEVGDGTFGTVWRAINKQTGDVVSYISSTYPAWPLLLKLEMGCYLRQITLLLR